MLLEKKIGGELNFKQVAMITHRIDGGEFPPHEVYHRFAAKDFLLCLVYFFRFATSYFVICCGHSVCTQYLGASKTALLFGFAV